MSDAPETLIHGPWETRVVCPGSGRNEPGHVTFNRHPNEGPCPDCGQPYNWVIGVRWPVKTMRRVYLKRKWWQSNEFLHWEERA